MFLLLGIGFLIAGGVLISEWVGGCSNKCRQILKTRREDREEAAHRLAENVAVRTPTVLGDPSPDQERGRPLMLFAAG